jgi:hypothetical protein
MAQIYREEDLTPAQKRFAIDRLLNLAKIRRQPPPSFRRLADAAHEALGDIDDDAVHARVDRWLDGRFLGGVVEVKLEQRDSNGADQAGRWS